MEKQKSLLDVVLDNIKVGDIVANQSAYWKVLRVNPIDNTAYCKQVVREEIVAPGYGTVEYIFTDVHKDEELMPRWLYIDNLDLFETVVVNDYQINNKELKETVDIMKGKLNGEEPRPHRQPDPETICYHVEYSMHYARGLELKELSDDEIIKFDGTIISEGKTWVFHTFHGYVMIPFESIIHMHPQY